MDLLSNPTTKTNLAANRIYASPDLAAGNATFRALTESDLPLITSVSTITPAYNDSLLIGDASPSQNGRGTISTVLSLGLQGVISGLELEWVSTTQIKVKSGLCHIQNGDIIIKLASDSTKTLSSLSANTWYYLYAFESSGAIDWEHSTTAPASPYFGTARSKTSDTSRRFIGLFKTGASSQIFKFIHNPLSGEYNYQEDFSVSPFRILAAGNQTSFTTVSASAVVPPIADLTLMRILNYSDGGANSSTGAIYITIPSDTSTNRLIINPNGDTTTSVGVDGSQQISYRLSVAPTGFGGAYIDTKSFFMKR